MQHFWSVIVSIHSKLFFEIVHELNWRFPPESEICVMFFHIRRDQISLKVYGWNDKNLMRVDAIKIKAWLFLLCVVYDWLIMFFKMNSRLLL